MREEMAEQDRLLQASSNADVETVRALQKSGNVDVNAVGDWVSEPPALRQITPGQYHSYVAHELSVGLDPTSLCGRIPSVELLLTAGADPCAETKVC
jgi:hypothetical protein